MSVLSITRQPVAVLPAGKYMLQFSGQSTEYWTEFKSIYEQNQLLLKDFFDVTFRVLEEEWASSRNEHPDWYPDGFRIQNWLTGQAPEAAVLRSAPVSSCLIFATQVANVLAFTRNFQLADDFFEHISVLVGHSQGVKAAILISLGLKGADFLAKYELFLRSMFWESYRAKEAYPELPLSPAMKMAVKDSDLQPTPMVLIRGINEEALRETVHEYNENSRPECYVYVGLKNADDGFVLCGSEDGLIGFRLMLSDMHSDWKFQWTYLNVDVPFHSPYLQSAVELYRNDLKRIGFDVQASELLIPVLATVDGSDLSQSDDLMTYICETSLIRSLDWGKVSKKSLDYGDLSRCLHFGPGFDGYRMTLSYLQGQGILFYNANDRKGQDAFFAERNRREKKWVDYAPQSRKSRDGKLEIINHFTEFTGRQPVFGGGMTPTTVETDIVTAAANAGYIVEWAGGGQVTEDILRQRIHIIKEDLNPGEGIIINLLYLDAYLWNLQYPLILKLRAEGYPIDGVTISAGIPDTDEALQILESLEASGVWLNAFKPGTTDQVRQVLRIAEADPSRTIVMHLEGGAAGGHHSWENLYELVLENYASIRSHANVLLCVGGGIYKEDQALRWLSGQWSEKAMPVDGIFLGTRLMSCQEAKTADSVKRKLAELSGGDNWLDGRKGEDVGGVISGKSGLGADIHYAVNHWARTSAWLEGLVQGKSTEEAAEVVQKNRDKIIEAVNKTTKPYFGELQNMTYSEVLHRFANLTALKAPASPEGQWPDAPFVDISFRRRLMRLIHAFESRAADMDVFAADSLLQDEKELNDVAGFLETLESTYPLLLKYRLLPEDIQLFLDVCMQPGKPVNFIPVIDASIVKWFRADSLWYSHCPGVDPEACAWIPGPVAVQGIQKANEPVVEVFDSFIEYVARNSPAATETNEDQYFAEADLDFVSSSESTGQASVNGRLPDRSLWLRALAQAGTGALSEWLSAKYLYHGKERIQSDIADLFAPRNNRTVFWKKDGNELQSIEVRDSGGLSIEAYVSENINTGVFTDAVNIECKIYYRIPGQGKSTPQIPFTRTFSVVSGSKVKVHENIENYEKRVADFYAAIWELPEIPDNATTTSHFETIDETMIQNFRLSTNQASRIPAVNPSENMAIYLVWKSLIGSLYLPGAGGNIFKLLHLFHEFEWLEGFQNLKAGDRVHSEVSHESLRRHPNGKEVRIAGTLSCEEQPVCKFRSGYFLRGNRHYSETPYLECSKKPVHFRLDTEAQVRYLKGLPGVKTDHLTAGEIEIRIIQRKDSSISTADPKPSSVSSPAMATAVSGADFSEKNEIHYFLEADILCNGQKTGTVSIDEIVECKDPDKSHPFFSKLQVFNTEQMTVLESPYIIAAEEIVAPVDMSEYSAASLDFNPIHTDFNFAAMAGLDRPIVHGMWTSSQAVRVITEYVLKGDSSRLLHIESRFENMVLPGDRLFVNVKHRAMYKGSLVLEVEISNTGGRVYSGTATVDSPLTAYVFTGQGSQSQGMGMKFYDQYAEAKKVWDHSNRMTEEELGFSLLDIVRENPASIRVDGKTWSHPKGVLHLTQFTQVGLVAKSLADWAVLKSRNALCEDAYFAGHSLGEYSALACRNILPMEGVLKIVYHRGLTMQNLVPRDEKGISPFGMSVVLGNRLIGLDEKAIVDIVNEVAAKTGKHLEVVNYNIRDKQYSVTGYLEALEAMEQELKKRTGGHKTFIRLPGIDVPFHSGILLDGVDHFREVLKDCLNAEADLKQLDGRYIPNLVARPFSIEKAFIEFTYEKSQSPVLADLIKRMEAGFENGQEIRRILLIELLAYQFAKPVLWIQTQEYLFHEAKIGRLIDIGARADLAGMAKQMLRDMRGISQPSILHVEDHHNLVFFELEDQYPAAGQDPLPEDKSEPVMPQDIADTTTVENIPADDSSEQTSPHEAVVSSGEALPDISMNRSYALKALLAWKSNIRFDEIGENDTIEELFKGNSSKRNQALADLGTEFNTTAIEGVHENALSDVAGILQKSTKYDKPGPFLRIAFDDFVKNHMPPGFGRNEIFEYLAKERLLSEGHIYNASVFIPLFARSGESSNGGPLSNLALAGRLSSKKEAQTYLDRVLDEYGKIEGISIPRKGGGSAGSSASMIDSAALDELEKKYFGLDGAFYKLMQYSKSTLFGEDPFASLVYKDRADLEANRMLALYKGEHGEVYDRILDSRFDDRKVVTFDNSLQWAKKNLIFAYHSGSIDEHVILQIASYSRELSEMIQYFSQTARIGKDESKISVMDRIESAIYSGFKPAFRPVQCSLGIDKNGTLSLEEKPDSDFQNWLLGLNQGHAEIRTTSDGGNSFDIDSELDRSLLEALSEINRTGKSFSGRTALVTGAGKNSIALEVVKNLLSGGARVFLTTSSYGDARIREYRRIFQEYGVKGSALTVLPFSQGSLKDIQELVSFIFKGGHEPDILIPFGAVSEENTLLTVEGGASLASVRVMLLGVQRLIAEMANQYRNFKIMHKKFDVLLPLSPNHGIFGRDGFYAETKIGLETLFRKHVSENSEWGRYCRLIGCRIGWVRGTGLMELNDVVAPDLESKCNVKTFHRSEMGLILTALAERSFEWDRDLIMAELSGGLDKVENLNVTLGEIRKAITEEARTRRELDNLLQQNQKAVEYRLIPSALSASVYPEIPNPQSVESLPDLSDLDLTNIVCVAGIGEISPGGSLRTRWEIEKDGPFSIEAVVELAWMMGLIVYEKTSAGHGWVERESGENLSEWQIYERYSDEVRNHTGIRIVNPELQGFDPEKIPVYTDIVLEDDFYIPAASEKEAREFQMATEGTEIYHDAETDRWFAKRIRGTTMKVLKAVRIDRYVAGQIPDGWDPRRYGIPADLVEQVDRITLFNIVATAEAFIAAGMEPFELYRYLHPTEVGTTSGSGMGGMRKLNRMFTDPLLDNKRQNDALQEALINVTAAWVITSMVGSAGPVQTPVSACATAGISIEMAMSLIHEGKARFMIAGAFDDLCGEGVIGFADMNATANSDEMIAHGISPSAMCRPNDTRRGGFLEAQGGGTVLLARGDVVKEMGLPVYGIMAYAASHSDGIQASIPAPGQGVASSARENDSSIVSDIQDRRKLLGEIDSILSLQKNDRQNPEQSSENEMYFAHLNNVKKAVKSHIMHDFWRNNNSISPLRGILSVFGLDADDIAVVFKHDTSTKANDYNENRLHHNIQEKLGRSTGNPILAVSQKSITGHSKGGAAAWQLAGLVQCMNEGIIPGNRNLDNVDETMNDFHFMAFSDEPLLVGKHRIRAGLLTTLGFGHVGAICLVLHADYFLSILSEEERKEYIEQRSEREHYTRYRMHEIMLNDKPLYSRKMKGPYRNDEHETSILLNPDARLVEEMYL